LWNQKLESIENYQEIWWLIY